jgi:hypothetical protein
MTLDQGTIAALFVGLGTAIGWYFQWRKQRDDRRNQRVIEAGTLPEDLRETIKTLQDESERTNRRRLEAEKEHELEIQQLKERYDGQITKLTTQMTETETACKQRITALETKLAENDRVTAELTRQIDRMSRRHEEREAR